MNHYRLLAVVCSFVTPVEAASWVADARGNGMGNTGVTTADFLLAPFYNPALTAVYRDHDDFGLLLPSVNLNVRDEDDTISIVDDLQDDIRRFESSGGSIDAETIAKMNGYLDDLSDNAPLKASGGVGVAVAIPHQTLAVNVYARGYVELFTEPKIAANTGNSFAAVKARYETSSIDLLAFGYTEFGVAFAKKYEILQQEFSLGITPKYQWMRTYKQSEAVKDFDWDDYDKSEVKDDAFNLDLGAVWLKNAYRVGISVKDLFNHSITTFDGQNHYKLDTQVTMSVGYVGEFLSAAVDVDMTKQERFTGKHDDTQFIRFGIEGNAWGWGQLRAGYEIDIENTVDNAMTVGLGISPGDAVSLDIAGSYAGEHQLGGSANLAFTF
ncbi:conjugal transfer protein TraF [Vibrio rhizosphaerae]|uniref:Conjugal transfer protein TraF n=1 Tax=Vibrio rhizosphaerae TaxID=398736 RepID=A0ABU4IX58_9VIBR|nr:conjugal transfer protein TraF [Vibrio rhizosphaerae]MDW6093986.1 conjugal transfer protein TraF [Vibrio rhizosphaerae]